MKYICYQGNDHDCGFASLKMLLASKSKNKSYLYIHKPIKRKDYTFYDLKRIASSYGFALSCYEIPKEDSHTLPRDCLVLLKENHLVYFIKATKRRVYYIDPAIGKASCKTKDFENKWKGLVIECVNAKDAKDIKIEKPRMTPLWMDVIYYAIIIVIFGSLMTGFYLINDNSNVIITMIFLLLFAIAELVENWYIIKELKFFDKRYIKDFFSRKCNQNIEKYKSYCDYKSNHFIASKVLFSSLILIFAFSVLLCMNDYRNVFVFLILLLLKILDAKLFSNKERDNIAEVEHIEELAFLSETTMIHSLMRANALANNIALRRALKKVIYMFISLCLSLGMMILNEVMSTNFIIFHFGIYFLMSEAFGNIISFFSNRSNRKIKKARFLDDCDL